MTPERASELCVSCGKCCRVVVACLPKWEGHDAYLQEEWAEARGMTRAASHDRPGWLAFFIPSICPQLDVETNRCRIYADRPIVCRVFDGRKDKDLECLWKAEV